MKNLKTLLAAVIGALVWLAPAWASPQTKCLWHDLSSVPNNSEESARKGSRRFKGGRAVRKETSSGDLRRCKNQHECSRESHNECRLSLATG